MDSIRGVGRLLEALWAGQDMMGMRYVVPRHRYWRAEARGTALERTEQRLLQMPVRRRLISAESAGIYSLSSSVPVHICAFPVR